MESLILVLATAWLVCLRAFQSENVIHGHYWLAVLTSYGMAFGEITLILYVVNLGFDSAIYVGTGGAIGVTCAMYIHRKYVQKKPATIKAQA